MHRLEYTLAVDKETTWFKYDELCNYVTDYCRQKRGFTASKLTPKTASHPAEG